MQKINRQKKLSERVQRFVCAEMPSRYSAKLQLFVENCSFRSLYFLSLICECLLRPPSSFTPKVDISTGLRKWGDPLSPAAIKTGLDGLEVGSAAATSSGLGSVTTCETSCEYSAGRG